MSDFNFVSASEVMTSVSRGGPICPDGAPALDT